MQKSKLTAFINRFLGKTSYSVSLFDIRRKLIKLRQSKDKAAEHLSMPVIDPSLEYSSTDHHCKCACVCMYMYKVQLLSQLRKESTINNTRYKQVHIFFQHVKQQRR